jgi:hypothetical protein
VKDGYRAGVLPEPFFGYPVLLANGRWRHHSSLDAMASDVERDLAQFGEGWTIVPSAGVQLQDPPRLLG